MSNGINSKHLRREIERYGKSYSQGAVVREYGLHPANGDPDGNSLGGPPFGLRLDCSADNHYVALPLGTWRRLIRHYSPWRPLRGEPRSSLECAKLLFGMPGWEFGVTGVALIEDQGGEREVPGKAGVWEMTGSQRWYNLLLVRDLEWDERRDNLIAWRERDPESFEHRWFGPGEQAAEPPVEAMMAQRVFWHVYDPLEDRWYYPPDPLNQSLLRSECTRWRGTSIYGYRPASGFPVDPNHPMRHGTITFG